MQSESETGQVKSMNIVFDLGGVVVNWRPAELVRSIVQEPASQLLMQSGIIGHPDWIALDRGTLTEGDAIERAVDRTGLPRTQVASLFEAVGPSLTVIPETVGLMQAAKEAGHRIFVLSNMHAASIAYLEDNCNFWELVDGAVISCRIRRVKPEAEIYEYLLAEYQLNPTETVFLDDLEDNVRAARSLGIRGIRFVDAVQGRRELAGLGCIPAPT